MVILVRGLLDWQRTFLATLLEKKVEKKESSEPICALFLVDRLKAQRDRERNYQERHRERELQ